MNTINVIVNRATWYRGKGHEQSQLLRDDGTRCCIGFYAQACGVPDALVRGAPCLSDIGGQHSSIPAQLRGKPWTNYNYGRTEASARYNFNVLSQCYEVNDSEQLTEEAREEELITLGRKVGVEFTFV